MKVYFKCILAALLIIPAAMTGNAQTDYYFVKGRVVDQSTGEPLAGASVFAENTTLGGVTNEEGDYKIWLPDGGYSLVVTFTGYETDITRVSRSVAQEGAVNFSLKEKVRSLEEVNIVITNEVSNGWEKYGTFFTDNFIGQSLFGKQCVIRNPEVLKFFFSKKKNQLKVLSEVPLVVDNFALGYVIRFAVDSFVNNYINQSILFTGQPLFEEMEGTEAQKNVWVSNRAKAFNGSMLHFMRSFYSRKLAENGFEIQFIVQRKDGDLPVRLGNVYGALNYEMNDAFKTVRFKPNQKVVALIYNKEKPEANYLALDTTVKARTFQLSTLTFPDSSFLTIEQNGYYYDQQDITTNGYLSYKKVGDMLPYDYGIARVNMPDEEDEDDNEHDVIQSALLQTGNDGMVKSEKQRDSIITLSGKEVPEIRNKPLTVEEFGKILKSINKNEYTAAEWAALKELLIRFLAEDRQ